MPSLSNRYPAAQRGSSPVRQSKPRPLPRSFPTPDNDNTPGTRKPRPLPDNDNFPGRKLPKSVARKAFRFGKLTPVGFALGLGVDYVLDTYLYPTLARYLASLGGWVVHADCAENRGNAWTIGAQAACVSQSGSAITEYPSAYDAVKAVPGTTGLTIHYKRPEIITGIYRPEWLTKDCSYTRPVGGSENWPMVIPRYVPEEFPWPEGLPLPSPEAWPVGVPYPSTPPPVRGPRPANNGNSTRDSSSPGSRTKKDTGFDPFPRRPRKGEKEAKIATDETLAAIVGKKISTYSEFGDFIDSIWEALDPYYRTNRHGEFRYRGHRTPNLHEKFNDIYHNLDRVDWTQAVKNLVLNEIQDQIIGRLIGKTTKVFGPNLGNALIAGKRIGIY